MTHRERVVAAVERHLARRGASCGFYPVDARYPAVLVAGCTLWCEACQTEAQAPTPRDVSAYNAALLGFLSQHKGCSGGEK